MFHFYIFNKKMGETARFFNYYNFFFIKIQIFQKLNSGTIRGGVKNLPEREALAQAKYGKLRIKFNFYKYYFCNLYSYKRINLFRLALN